MNISALACRFSTGSREEISVAIQTAREIIAEKESQLSTISIMEAILNAPIFSVPLQSSSYSDYGTDASIDDAQSHFHRGVYTDGAFAELLAFAEELFFSFPSVRRSLLVRLPDISNPVPCIRMFSSYFQHMPKEDTTAFADAAFRLLGGCERDEERKNALMLELIPVLLELLLPDRLQLTVDRICRDLLSKVPLKRTIIAFQIMGSVTPRRRSKQQSQQHQQQDTHHKHSQRKATYDAMRVEWRQQVQPHQ